MKVYALWFGGSSYAYPTVKDDLEEFASIASAKRVFYSRSDHDPYYPCVEDTCEMFLFFDRPPETDPYPDRILTLGPRGGVRVERC
jgi:hypothetical protein